MADVSGSLSDGVLVERYHYKPGPPEVLPRHVHEEYQLNVALGAAGGVRYRGGYHVVASGELSVIMPGEPHAPRDPDYRNDVATHLTMYLPQHVFPGPPPAFPDLVVGHAEAFIGAHAALAGPASALARETRLAVLLTRLTGRRATTDRPIEAHRAVRRARDYLHAHVFDDVSLTRLAQVAGLSRFRLARLFSQAVGVPPHTYHTQLRLERAKRLLIAGVPVSAAAHDTGFFDLSHFTRHFKRYVGVAPGRYAPRR